MARRGKEDGIRTNKKETIEEEYAGIPIELLIAMTETTYPIRQIHNEFRSSLISSGLDEEIVSQLALKQSPDRNFGDIGMHCAPLAKIMRKKPEIIANELASQLPISPDGLILGYVAVGAYVNARINHELFANLVRNSVFEMGADYGKEQIGNGQRIVIDMSSPNIAKRMSVGHLRSTIIGDSLARIYKHLDFDVIKDNHIGDWGTQFGHLLRAIELWGDLEAIENNPIEELQKLYVKISDAGEADSKLYEGLTTEEAKLEATKVKDEGRKWFRRLEQGDPEARARWQQIVDWSLVEFQRIYDVLGVDFDLTRGESFYEDMLQDAIQRVKDSGIATESKGALVVDMEDVNLGTAIVQKSDSATLYLTREIATGMYRSEIDNVDGMIYVVGDDQKFYFEQFFEILRRMGNPIANKSKHVYFGMISLPEGKMSTRKGRVVLLEDVIDEAFDRTKALVNERSHVTTEEEKENLVRQVAVGALKWNDLMAGPQRSIVFKWETMLSMDGNSAPYVQYAHARAASLLESIDFRELQAVSVKPEHDTEKALIQLVAEFPQVVMAAGESYNPSKIAAHVYELAKAFNAFYHEVDVLRENNSEKRMSRLAITVTVAQTIQTGLGLLGIEAPMRM